MTTQKFVWLLSSLLLLVISSSQLLPMHAHDNNNTTLRTVSVECRESDFRSAAYPRPHQMPRQIEGPVDSLEAIERKTVRRLTLMATNPNPSMHTKEEDRLTKADSESASSREAELRSLVALSKRNLGSPEDKYIKERIWEQQVLVWLDELGIEPIPSLPVCTEEARPIGANRTTCAMTSFEEFGLVIKELILEMDRQVAVGKLYDDIRRFRQSMHTLAARTRLYEKAVERELQRHTEELNRRQWEQLVESYMFIVACLFLGIVWTVTVFRMGWNDVKPVV